MWWDSRELGRDLAIMFGLACVGGIAILLAAGWVLVWLFHHVRVV